MAFDFYEQPILNSPYAEPARHWEQTDDGQPTGQIRDERRPVRYTRAIPRPKKQLRGQPKQLGLALPDTEDFVTIDGQAYEIGEKRVTQFIQNIRAHVDRWRRLPRDSWGVTATTARLLEHWRTHEFRSYRPFFCQIEAVETAIWLAEVAPKLREAQGLLEQLRNASRA